MNFNSNKEKGNAGLGIAIAYYIEYKNNDTKQKMEDIRKCAKEYIKINIIKFCQYNKKIF